MAISQDAARLCGLLVEAASKLVAIQGPIWSSYDSGAKIADFVIECKKAVETDTITTSQKRELWSIFAPTCDWDDVVGDVLLGEEVYTLLNKLYWEEIKIATDQSPK
jgi:hypothetical protein